VPHQLAAEPIRCSSPGPGAPVPAFRVSGIQTRIAASVHYSLLNASPTEFELTAPQLRTSQVPVANFEDIAATVLAFEVVFHRLFRLSVAGPASQSRAATALPIRGAIPRAMSDKMALSTTIKDDS
jgi:hypothetical protein